MYSPIHSGHTTCSPPISSGELRFIGFKPFIVLLMGWRIVRFDLAGHFLIVAYFGRLGETLALMRAFKSVFDSVGSADADNQLGRCVCGDQ